MLVQSKKYSASFLSVELTFGFALAVFLLAGRQQLPFIAADLGPSVFTTVRFLAVVALTVSMVVVASGRAEPVAGWATTQKLSAACLLWLLLRSLVEVQSEYAFEKLQDIALLSVVVICIAAVSQRESARAIAKIAIFSLVALAVCLAFIAMLSPSVTQSGRVAALGGGPNVFGRIMGFIILAGLHLMVAGRRFPGIGMVGLGGVMLLLSGSRGAIFGAGCGVAACLLLTRSQLSPRGLAMGLLGGFGAVAGIAILSGKAVAAVQVLVFRIVELTFRQGYTSNREPLVDEAVRQFLSAPMFGEGVGSYQWTGVDAYPHNILLELGVEGGGIAVLLFCALGVIFLHGVRHVRTPSLASFLASAWVAITAASFFSGDLFDARAAFVLPAMLPMVAPKIMSPAPPDHG